MSIRSSVSFASLFAAAVIVSLVGCAADGDEPNGDDAFAAGDESELRADTFVGHWSGPAEKAGDFVSLDLKANGHYEAAIAVCPTAPAGGVGCLALPRTETGKFNLLGSAASKTLRLVPNGASVRRYKLAIAPSVEGVRAVELTRSGRGQVLNQEVPLEGEACGASHCGAGTVCCNPLLSICTAPGDVCAQ